MLHLLTTIKNLDFARIGLAAVDILVVAYIVYRLILLAKGRRAWQIIIGLGIFFLLVIASDRFGLVTLNWLLKQVTPLGPVAIVILLYPELRDVLERLGRLDFWGAPLHVAHREDMTVTIEEVVRAATALLAPRKTGALIVMERETGLDDVVASGTRMDAEVSSELLGTLFYSGTPLHDGAVLIRGNRIVAAGCVLPLSDSPNIASNVHMRHRAALGVSENSDAVVVIVSEETGTVSVAIGGKLIRGLKDDTLRNRLLEAFGRGASKREGRPTVNIPFVRRKEETDNGNGASVTAVPIVPPQPSVPPVKNKATRP